MVDSFAPVLLFVYNRPDHTRTVLNVINSLVEAPMTELYIFSDGPKYNNIDSLEKVESVRSVIRDFERISNFRKVNVSVAVSNKGLAESIIQGVTRVIERHGKVIVLEDDLIVSDDFLSYMNEALNFYQSNDNVWAISAYSFPMNSLDYYPHDVYVSGRACSWGWATWAEKWRMTDWNVFDYGKFKWSYSQRTRFSRWGKDLPTMLDAYEYGEIHSWAIRWCYSAFRLGKNTIYPKISRVQNKGTDGSGTNFSSIETRYDTNIAVGHPDCFFENVEENEAIRKEFANCFVSPIQLLKMRIRWFIIRLGFKRIVHAKNK